MSGAVRRAGDRERYVFVAFLLAAFVAPGAWMLVRLPSPPVAQAFFLGTAAVLVSVVAWGGPRLVGRTVPRDLLALVLAVAALCVVSLAANEFPVQQMVYDLYAEMPAALWLTYPLVFLAAAGLRYEAGLRDGLKALVFAGLFLVLVMAVWRWSEGFVLTFGSPAYSVPALAPLPFALLGLAATSRRSATLYRVAALLFAAGLVWAAAGLSAPYMLGMGVLVTLVLAPELLAVPARAQRLARMLGSVLLVIALVGTAFAQFPTLASAVVDVDSAMEGNQTVATRLHLWGAAERMVADRPLLGFGPAGYRYSAVDYYEPGVFGYLGAIGTDPIAFSAPSPHSLLWEVLTRLGVLGLAALVALGVAWGRGVREALGADTKEHRPLRLALAVGFAAYLLSLLVTPVHFASGLLGVVFGGLAVASSGADGHGERWPRAVSVAAVVIAVALVSYGVWRMAGLTAGAPIPASSVAEQTARYESAARIIPGDPLNERRRLELALWGAGSADDLAGARERIDSAPGYITGFVPNLPHFAFLGMTRGEALGEDDFSWERGLLEQAAEVAPELPSLVAEQLHLAILEGDEDSLLELMERAERYAQTYPMTGEYIIRAREILVP